MARTDLEYAIGFLKARCDDFAQWLEAEFEIDGTEAELIIDELDALSSPLWKDLEIKCRY